MASKPWDNNGTWYITIQVNGKPKKLSTGFPSKDAYYGRALEFKRDTEAQYRLKLHPLNIETSKAFPEKEKVKTLMNEFLKRKQQEVADKSFRLYKLALTSYYKYSNPTVVGQLTEKTIRDWYYSGKYSGETLTTYKRHVRTFFSWLYRERYIDRDPFIGLKLTKPKPINPVYYTQREINSLVKEMEKWYAENKHSVKCRDAVYPLISLFRFAIYTGLRRSELINLKWTDIDFEGKKILISIGKKRLNDVIPLIPKAEAVLNDVTKKKGNFVFSYTGRRMSGNSITRRMKVFIRKLGLNDHLDIHACRHTTGYLLASEGMNQRAIQIYLRHRSIQTTSIYTQVDFTALQSAATKIFDGLGI